MDANERESVKSEVPQEARRAQDKDEGLRMKDDWGGTGNGGA